LKTIYLREFTIALSWNWATSLASSKVAMCGAPFFGDSKCSFETLRQRASSTTFSILVDGSFVTAVDAPNDIDLILVLKRDRDFTASTRPFEYNVVSRHRIRRRYGFDVLIAKEGSAQLLRNIEFFGQVRNRDDIRKGLLRLIP
jgi:hypothetical protein